MWCANCKILMKRAHLPCTFKLKDVCTGSTIICAMATVKLVLDKWRKKERNYFDHSKETFKKLSNILFIMSQMIIFTKEQSLVFRKHSSIFLWI